MKSVYFGVCPNKDEIECIRLARPRCVLLSFFFWRNKCLKKDFLDKIGYRPTIMIDSGAYSFYTRHINNQFWLWMESFVEEWTLQPGNVLSFIRQCELEEDINLDIFLESPFMKYVTFLKKNRAYFDYCVSFDTIHDPVMSNFATLMLQHERLPVMPTFHLHSDMCYLDELVDSFSYVGLGGMAHRMIPMREKATFVQSCADRHPELDFHFFGSLDVRLWKHISQVTSVDGSSWLATFNALIQTGETKVSQSVQNIIKKERQLHELSGLVT